MVINKFDEANGFTLNWKTMPAKKRKNNVPIFKAANDDAFLVRPGAGPRHNSAPTRRNNSFEIGQRKLHVTSDLRGER